MTDLLSTLQLVLKDGGYQCWLMAVERRTGVMFEDDALMGFGYISMTRNPSLNGGRRKKQPR